MRFYWIVAEIAKPVSHLDMHPTYLGAKQVLMLL